MQYAFMLAQLQWLIQITTAKKEIDRVNRNLSSEVQYYHVGLPMSKFGCCTIACNLYSRHMGQMVASIQWSRFGVAAWPVAQTQPSSL